MPGRCRRPPRDGAGHPCPRPRLPIADGGWCRPTLEVVVRERSGQARPADYQFQPGVGKENGRFRFHCRGTYMAAIHPSGPPHARDCADLPLRDGGDPVIPPCSAVMHAWQGRKGPEAGGLASGTAALPPRRGPHWLRFEVAPRQAAYAASVISPVASARVRTAASASLAANRIAVDLEGHDCDQECRAFVAVDARVIRGQAECRARCQRD